MKRLTSTALALAVFTSLGAQAQTDNQPGPESQVAVTAPAAPAHLPYGVDDVVKLTRAKVGEDVIVSFVENSGIPYSLRANDIVFLREQGVTDHVLSVMLAQKKAVANTAPAPAQPVQPPMVPSEYPQYPQQPATDYTEPVSSSYVIPYATAAYPYYSSYGYGYGYPYYYASFGYPYCGYGGYYGRYCGYGRYGHYGYPYRGYYGHNNGFTAIHSGVGVHSGFNGHVGAAGHSGFTAIGGGPHVGGATHFGGGGGGGAHIGGGGGHMMAGGGGHFSGGGGGGHMGGGHR